MAKKKKENPMLIRLYIPEDRVYKFWAYFDAWSSAEPGANNWELYRLWKFVGRCFDGGDYSNGWGIASEGIFHPFIYLLEDE